MTEPNLTLHGLRLSGHAHRAELFLSLLGLPYRFVEAGPARRETPEFRRLNPLGQIPVLEDGDTVIADSNAILVYLAARYAPGSGWMPGDPLGAAHVQRWLSLAAGEVRHGPAQARMMVLFGAQADRATVEATTARALRFMDGHLTRSGRSSWATGRRSPTSPASPTWPDAPEGGVPLAPYPAIRAWIGRIEALPGFIAMPASPIPDAA